MNNYKGVKIYDKVIIVEKTEVVNSNYHWKGRTVNQGYVVDPNNADSLKNAQKWAKWKHRGEDTDALYDEYRKLDKQYIDHYRDPTCSEEYRVLRNEAYEKYQDSYITEEGVVHEYENGQFELILDEAAGYSSQGGKLSFWNCVIKAPDGQAYLIGINADLLLHLMMSTTLIKGKCQDKVWLGRIGGNQVGVFTPEMDDFKQAKTDELQRQAVKKANTKYVPGDVVKTLQSKALYLGPVYKYFQFYERYSFFGSGGYNENILVIYKKPKLVHVFQDIYESYNNPDDEVFSSGYDLRESKPKRVFVEHKDLQESVLESLNKYFQKESDSYLKQSKADLSDYYKIVAWEEIRQILMYGTSSEAPDGKKLLEELNALFDKYHKDIDNSQTLASTYIIIDEQEFEEKWR